MTSGVDTFEVAPEGLKPLGSVRTLAEASAALPEGAYTTFRTYGGRRFVRLDHHLRRLEESIAIGGTPAGLDRAAVRSAIAEALRRAGHAEARLRLTFAPPRLFVSIEPFVPLPESLYGDGILCVTVPVRREAPQAKDTHFLGTADRTYRQLPPGVHEALMVGEDGAILEGLSSNFFALHGGVLRTEEARALAGVTRALALEAARGLLPVVRIDDHTIADGRPGPVTRELRRRFEDLIEREAEEAEG